MSLAALPPGPGLAAALQRAGADHGLLRVAAGRGQPIAASLLEEAAQRCGAVLLRPSAAEAWAIGLPPKAAEALCRQLAELGLPAQIIPAAAAPLLSAAAVAPARVASAAPAPLALPENPLPVWRIEGGVLRLLAQRWLPGLPAGQDGAAGQEAELAAHGRDLCAARMLEAAQAGAWPRGWRRGLPLWLDLPALPLPPPLPAPPDGLAGHALVLPLCRAVDAGLWQAAAAAAGWQLAWRGMAPELAPLLAPGRLPGGMVLAAWRPGLPDLAWPAPERLVIEALPDRAALRPLLRAGFALLGLPP